MKEQFTIFLILFMIGYSILFFGTNISIIGYWIDYYIFFFMGILTFISSMLKPTKGKKQLNYALRFITILGALFAFFVLIRFIGLHKERRELEAHYLIEYKNTYYNYYLLSKMYDGQHQQYMVTESPSNLRFLEFFVYEEKENVYYPIEKEMTEKEIIKNRIDTAIVRQNTTQ